MKQNQLNYLIEQVAQEIMTRLEFVRIQPQSILNLGSDFASAGLKNCYPEANIFNKTNLAELADLKTESIDFIFSNFTLAWVENLDQSLQELHRILKPNGLLMFSTLGPDSLIELRKICTIKIFFDMHDLGDALLRHQFLDPVMDREDHRLHYADPQKIIADLNDTFPQIKIDQAIASNLNQLTFEVVYGHTWRGEIKQHTQEDGEVWVPLKKLTRRNI